MKGKRFWSLLTLKCLLYKPSDLGLDVQDPQKKPGVVHIRNPKTARDKDRQIAAIQSSQTGKLQVQGETWLKKQGKAL